MAHFGGHIDLKIPELEYVLPKHIIIVNCGNCEALYSEESPPFIIGCGHSVCLQCKNKFVNSFFTCYRCSKELPSLLHSVKNEALLQQVMQLNTNSEVVKEMQKVSLEATTDPYVQATNLFKAKCAHILYVLALLKNAKTSLQEEDRSRSIINTYIEAIKNFNDEDQSKVPLMVANLRKLADAIEQIKQDIEAYADIERIHLKFAIVKDLFFRRFQLIEIQFNFETICRWIKEFAIFSINKHESKICYSKIDLLPLGLQLQSFTCDQPPQSATLYIWHRDALIHCTNEAEAKYAYLDLKAKIKEKLLSRRIYVKLSETTSASQFVELCMLQNGHGYHGTLVRKGGGVLVSQLPVAILRDFVPYQLVLEDVAGWNSKAVGLLSFSQEKENGVFHIWMTSKGQIKSSLVIGTVCSGIKFLHEISESSNCTIEKSGIILVKATAIEKIIKEEH